MNIRAIETRYKGYRFRSRLEARWAVFFDSLPYPEKWEYEKEGYDLDSRWYLPDFYLPRFGCFIEVKGEIPTADELTTASLLRDKTDKSIAIFHGLPSENAGTLFCHDIGDSSAGRSEWEVILGNDNDGNLIFGARWLHDKTLCADDTFSSYIPAMDWGWVPCVATDIALEEAKAARFEHGLTPRPTFRGPRR